MKEIKIEEAIRRDEALLKDVERVNQLLEEEIGPSSATISVEWSVHDIPFERLYKLEISDDTDHSSSVFSRRSIALISQLGLRISLIRLWGDLLQARSHKQVENLKLIVQGLRED